MNIEDMLQVGIITSAHGIKGEVNVFPTTDDVNRFKKLKTVYYADKTEVKELSIAQVKFFKNMVILKFKEISDRNEAEKMKKVSIYVDRAHAVKLEKDEYFIADLMGLTVKEDGTDTVIGELTDVLQTGANDVYEITFDSEFMYEGARPKSKVVYIPAIKDCVQSVDMDNREMYINIMPGLID